MMGAGSGGSSDASLMEVQQSLTSLLSLYLELEKNPKVKQDTNSRINALLGNLGGVSAPVILGLRQLTSSAEACDYVTANNVHREIAQKYFPETKEWINNLKFIIQVKQKNNA